jgi:hypothetical protein
VQIATTMVPPHQQNSSQQELFAQIAQQLVVLIVNIVIPETLKIIQQYYFKEPCYTSILTGQAWVNELLHGHPKCIRTALGMNKHVFRALLSELRGMGHGDSKYITLEEQLAIFLHCCVTGLPIRHLEEQFQHAPETISV